jgi:F0F1-type ATP synthase epsilon subunit
MAKRDINKDISSMSADEILRATGNAPAPDAAPVAAPDPELAEVAAVAAEMGVEVPAPVTPIAATTGNAPDPWVVLQQIATALTVLTQRASGGEAPTESKAIERLTSALERMTAAQINGAEKALEESRKAFRPSNTVIPNVSVFNRRGTGLDDYKKPPLKCLMMIPWLVEWESCTREEVELLNLLEPGTYVVKRADRSKITMTVAIQYKADNVTPSQLTVSHESAFNNDNFKNMAPLPDFLRDMLKQHDRRISQAASSVLTDEEEEAMIEAGDLSVSK